MVIEYDKEIGARKHAEAAAALTSAGSHWITLSAMAAEIYPTLNEGYNEYDPDSVATMVKTINALVPPVYYNPDNPNNGKPANWWIVGRESTDVMYLIVDLSAIRNVDWTHERVSNLFNGVESAAREARANEYWPMQASEMGPLCFNEHSICYRIWWD